MTTISEQIITATLTRGFNTDTADKLLSIDTLVRRTITCAITNKVLDSRTANLITVGTPKGPLDQVVHPDASSDVIAERLEANSFSLDDRYDSSTDWAGVSGN